jgi:hypothetical protein
MIADATIPVSKHPILLAQIINGLEVTMIHPTSEGGQ